MHRTVHRVLNLIAQCRYSFTVEMIQPRQVLHVLNVNQVTLLTFYDSGYLKSLQTSKFLYVERVPTIFNVKSDWYSVGDSLHTKEDGDL